MFKENHHLTLPSRLSTNAMPKVSFQDDSSERLYIITSAC